MFVPNTREPQKIPGSQITRGLQVGCSRSSLSDHRGARAVGYLRKALAKRDLLMCIPPFASSGPWYSIKPSFLNLFI
jgi:hypothetical protein